MKPFDAIFGMLLAILIGIFAGKQEWGWVSFSVSFLIVHLVDSAIEVLSERKHK